MTTASRLDAATVRETARGQWQGLILPALGIEVPSHPRRHGPCPRCGGKDRFRFDDQDGRGSWYCNQCTPRAGDGFSLVQNVRGCDFPTVLEMVADVLSLEPHSRTAQPVMPRIVRIDRKARANQFELAALDLRLRAEKILQAANGIDVSELESANLDKVLAHIASAHADIERAQLFEQTADGLMERHYAQRSVAR